MRQPLSSVLPLIMTHPPPPAHSASVHWTVHSSHDTILHAPPHLSAEIVAICRSTVTHLTQYCTLRSSTIYPLYDKSKFQVNPIKMCWIVIPFTLFQDKIE
jgi:hypothetical protein